MFSIGQHVIHPGQGVCTVVGFRDDTPQPMLLLETKQGHAQTILMYPVAQADRLHAAISQQDAEHLLSPLRRAGVRHLYRAQQFT